MATEAAVSVQAEIVCLRKKIGELRRMNNARIGRRIETLRLSRGLTRRQLANELGKTDTWVWNIETGYRAPSSDTAKQLADIFGVSVAAILDGSEPEHASM